MFNTISRVKCNSAAFLISCVCVCERDLNADAAAYTQRFGDPHNLTLGRHFNTQLSCRRDGQTRVRTQLWNRWRTLGVCVLISPIRTTGQLFLHSCLHFFGLHLSWLTIAIRVFLSAILSPPVTTDAPPSAVQPRRAGRPDNRTVFYLH